MSEQFAWSASLKTLGSLRVLPGIFVGCYKTVFHSFYPNSRCLQARRDIAGQLHSCAMSRDMINQFRPIKWFVPLWSHCRTRQVIRPLLFIWVYFAIKQSYTMKKEKLKAITKSRLHSTLKASKKQNSPLTLCTAKLFVQTVFYIRDILLCTKFTVLT